LQEAYSEGTVPWPNIRSDFGQHRSHIVVSTFGNLEDRESFLEAALIVTLVSGAIVWLKDGLGTYWPHAEYITDPEDSIKAAYMAANRAPPVGQWVRLSLRPGPDKTIGIFTSGLLPFIGREIEFPPDPSLSPGMMMERIAGLSKYLIANGLVIKDKETIGISNDERIRVRYARSRNKPDTPVLVLRVEHSE